MWIVEAGRLMGGDLRRVRIGPNDGPPYILVDAIANTDWKMTAKLKNIFVGGICLFTVPAAVLTANAATNTFSFSPTTLAANAGPSNRPAEPWRSMVPAWPRAT
jgi:hypothetical protein